MRVVIAAVLCLFTTSVLAEGCLKTAQAVRDSTGAWPSWSRNVKGHSGEKCWFGTGKRRSHVVKINPRPPSVTIATSRIRIPTTAAGAVPPPLVVTVNRPFRTLWDEIVDSLTFFHVYHLIDFLDPYAQARVTWTDTPTWKPWYPTR